MKARVHRGHHQVSVGASVGHARTSHRFGYHVSDGAVVALTSPSHAWLEFALKLCVSSADCSAAVSKSSSSRADKLTIDGQHLSKGKRHAMLEWGVCVMLRVCGLLSQERVPTSWLDGQHPSKRHMSFSVCS